MLQIEIPDRELFDEATNMFINIKGQKLHLEHSLISLSKWEAITHKPFLRDNELTREETLEYIRCMTLTQNVRPEIYQYLTKKNIQEIHAYIKDSRTATTFPNLPPSQSGKRETVTSELIYYWMASFGIPFECEKWHLNRLLTLIQVFNVKSTPPKKRSPKEIRAWQRAENMRRCAQWGTKG